MDFDLMLCFVMTQSSTAVMMIVEVFDFKVAMSLKKYSPDKITTLTWSLTIFVVT